MKASKAEIIIAFNGKNYRVANSWRCRSKRDCDLFQRGVCDSEHDQSRCPCDPILDAFQRIDGSCPINCFKEIRK